jgi:hypothetical protein
LFKKILGERVGGKLGGKAFPAENLGLILAGNFLARGSIVLFYKKS